jgi:hypothetical protein
VFAGTAEQHPLHNHFRRQHSRNPERFSFKGSFTFVSVLFFFLKKKQQQSRFFGKRVGQSVRSQKLRRSGAYEDDGHQEDSSNRSSPRAKLVRNLSSSLSNSVNTTSATNSPSVKRGPPPSSPPTRLVTATPPPTPTDAEAETGEMMTRSDVIPVLMARPGRAQSPRNGPGTFQKVSLFFFFFV